MRAGVVLIGVGLALLVVVAVSLVDGSSRPARNARAGTPPVAGTGPLRLPAVTLSITTAGATKRSVCTLEASTTAEQERGLMGQRSLQGYAGMAFVFSAPSTVQFYMKDTLIPLTVAWFDPAGRYIGSATMPVCPPGTMCPTYAADRPYTLAVEVPAGGLGALGIGPGSTASVGGPCSA